MNEAFYEQILDLKTRLAERDKRIGDLEMEIQKLKVALEESQDNHAVHHGGATNGKT